MLKNKAAIIIMIIFFMISLLGCSSQSIINDNEELSAEEVIEQFFQWYQEKDLEKMKSFFLEENKNMDSYSWQFDTIDTIQFIHMEKKPEAFVEKYMQDNNKRMLSEANSVGIYQIKYEVVNKEGLTGIYEDGEEQIWWFILIKEQEESPWKIDSFGTAL